MQPQQYWYRQFVGEEEKTKSANELEGLLAPGLQRIESNIGAKLKAKDFEAVRRLVKSAVAKILRER